MWGKADAFHFLWKKMSGNAAVTADVQFVGSSASDQAESGAHDPGKASTQTPLTPISLSMAMARIAAQWRLAAGDVTGDVMRPDFLDTASPTAYPHSKRRGNSFTVLAGKPGGQLAAMAPFTVTLTDPVYVGLAVCSHDANGLTAAEFENVGIETLPQGRGPQPGLSQQDFHLRHTRQVHSYGLPGRYGVRSAQLVSRRQIPAD